MLIPAYNHVRLYSSGIRRTPHTDILLSAIASHASYNDKKSGESHPDAIAGWGYKKTADYARHTALKAQIPYIALEDGFLRSVGLGIHGAPSLSFIADDKGIYYDRDNPSRLHDYLGSGEALRPENQERAARLMAYVRDKRLSKYNTGCAIAPEMLRNVKGHRILLVDQTYGDASLAGTDPGTFLRMIDHARANHQNSTLLIKTHPDVLSGRKRGCFPAFIYRDPGFTIIEGDICPYTLFDHVDEIYVVSSNTGFEALLAGKPVHCFGRPWYAGYGVTIDHSPLPTDLSPASALSVESLFDSAFIKYPLYIDPYAQAPCTPERSIEVLSFLKEKADKVRGPVVAYRISKWKRQSFAPYLNGTNRILYTSRGKKALQLAQSYDSPIVAWSSKLTRSLENSCAEKEIRLIRAEDGFIRSIGLGAALTPAASLVFDDKGIYYDCRSPSHLETILQSGIEDPLLLSRAHNLHEMILRHDLTKYNIVTDHAESLILPSGKRRILVAGQVENDASIRYGANNIRGNLELLRAVRNLRPEDYIIYKPHPDVMAGYRPGSLPEQDILLYADRVFTGSASQILPLVDEVHVISSLIGFEALLRGKTVHAYGLPFYAGWGLTVDHQPCARRQRRLSLQELIAGALILYPDYLDPVSGLPCPPEILLNRLAKGKTLTHQDGCLMMAWRALGRGWRLPAR